MVVFHARYVMENYDVLSLWKIMAIGLKYRENCNRDRIIGREEAEAEFS